MKKPLLLILFQTLLTVSAHAEPQLKDGDIIFQTYPSSQTLAIQIATGSKYTHCGVIFMSDKGEPEVWEASGPVQVTPMNEFVSRDPDRQYVIKRIVGYDTLLVDSTLDSMRRVGQSMMGKPYDWIFNWSDDKLYCSEYVWKLYDRTLGIELCDLHKLKEYHLDNPLIQQKLRERYGDDVPLDEPVVAPGDLFDSNLLQTVFESGKAHPNR